MPDFTYVGITEEGQRLEGVVEAFDDIEAMERAHEHVRVVQSVKPVAKTANIFAVNITKPHAKDKNLAVMCSQFAIVMRAGIPIARAVALVAEQTTDKYLRGVLSDMTQDVASGHGLADSFESKGPELPRVFIETVRAGENSGHLPEGFERLNSYYDKRAKIKAKVASALTYPIFVLVIAVVVVAVMMVMVIPAISGMVSSLGTDMPGITQFLINTSDWVTANWILLIAIIVAIIIGVKAFGKTERGKTFFARMKLKMPVLGKINVYSSAAQFANTMSTLVSAGLPINTAVASTSRVMDNYIMTRDVGRMVAGLEEGRTLGECMEGCRFLPSTLIEMTTVGEQTGSLEETLETMGEFYDAETQRVTDRALALMEPALLILMAGFAGFIVIALYLPLFTMYGAM